MNAHWNKESLAMQADMAGCPNRCRHCWLSAHKNGHMSADDVREIAAAFRAWRDLDGRGIGSLTIQTWWREPDYRDDYRELWTLEQELSSPGAAVRFELLSSWRLARDEGYAPWAAAIGPKACQLTFAGMEETTDWFMRRRGAFKDNLLATERLIEAGMSPRWQLFPTKRSLGELMDFYKLISELELYRRCEEKGLKFEFFIWSMSPEGSAYELEDIRLEEGDLELIPKELVELSRDDLSCFGEPEYKLLPRLLKNRRPPEIWPGINALAVNAAFDVYPNNAEPTDWWRLGNLKTDGVDRIMQNYINESTPAMIANKSMPIFELARRFGEPNSKKLYDEGDLVARFMHQMGAAL